ncbi:MAG: PfkB family carbohydrate kinase [Promethearchaeota archaeon]
MSNQNQNSISIFFAGHFAIDTIIRFQKENEPTLGGSVTYCSLALSTYTQNVDIKIISNIGKSNFSSQLLDPIINKNIDLSGIKWSETNNTNFILTYFDHSRILTLKSRSPDLRVEDIPIELINNPPDAIVLVPLCNEISADYVLKILEKYPQSYIGIDLQGFIRNINENGEISLIRDEFMIKNMYNIIDLIGDKLILKGSEEEMRILSGKDELHEVMEYFNDVRFRGISIMTLGERGSMITKYGNQLQIIPSFKSEAVEDETGAGDVYLAIFIYEFLISDKSWDAICQAAYLASSAASFLVEKKGPAGFQNKERVLERINNKNYFKKG